MTAIDTIDLLRRTAQQIRFDVNNGDADGHMLPRESEWLAIAEWLDQHVNDHGGYDCQWIACAAERFARIYMGEDV